jgi:2-amino-4-hydroxy-6-hydroxymethyldihydropteridine diphosphokinase
MKQAGYACYIGLGSNLGDRGETVREALRRIGALDGVVLQQVSHFYETAPWGRTDQPAFLNAAAEIFTELAPLALLHACQAIETALGRERHEHWGARTLDIDLLHIPGVGMDSEELQLPHPYLTERAFALVPLAEIAPQLQIAGHMVAAWCKRISDQAVAVAAEVFLPYPLQLLACMDAGRGIGCRNRLLLQLPEDMEQFRQKTIGNIVIMGRRTMETLPGKKPLPGRINIVLSRQLEAETGFVVCHDRHALWQQLGSLMAAAPERIAWCIGGASVYQLLLPYVSRAYITQVHHRYEADAFMPALTGFACIERQTTQTADYCLYERQESFPGT